MNDTKGYDAIMVNTYNNLTLLEAIDILMKNDCCRIEAYNKHHMSIRKKNCIQYRDALYEETIDNVYIINGKIVLDLRNIGSIANYAIFDVAVGLI